MNVVNVVRCSILKVYTCTCLVFIFSRRWRHYRVDLSSRNVVAAAHHHPPVRSPYAFHDCQLMSRPISTTIAAATWSLRSVSSASGRRRSEKTGSPGSACRADPDSRADPSPEQTRKRLTHTHTHAASRVHGRHAVYQKLYYDLDRAIFNLFSQLLPRCYCHPHYVIPGLIYNTC